MVTSEIDGRLVTWNVEDEYWAFADTGMPVPPKGRVLKESDDGRPRPTGFWRSMWRWLAG